MTKKVNFFSIQTYKNDSFLVSSTNLVKILHRFSFSFSSVTLSCNDYLYNLSKELLVRWSVLYCLLYLLYLFLITPYITLLPIDSPHLVAVDIGIAIKPIPMRLKVIELDVVSKLTNVSNDFNIVVSVL